MTQPAREEFARRLTTSLQDDTFVRLILTRPLPAADAPDKLIARLIHLKTGSHLSLTYRYATRDVTQNLPVADAGSWIASQLGDKFQGALLCTTKRDWQFAIDRPRLITHKPSSPQAPSRDHDQAPQTILDDTARDWLTGLGILNQAGNVRVALADKYAQINRYLEIFSHLAKDAGLRTIADMGCGKGYLTFGMWHLLHRVWQQPVRIIGVEARPDLVATTSALANQMGATGLQFVTGSINATPLPPLDALIALHACNTATDDAIRRGIALRAKLILVAPCCHQAIRPQLGKPAPLAPVLEHGIMAERLAEWVTDGLRALHLEAAGYRTKIIEFVATEHTPKNLLIAGIRTGRPANGDQITPFKTFFGITHDPLDELGNA